MSSGKFIVVFKKNVTSDTIDKHGQELSNAGGSIHNKFDSSIMKGFSATIPEAYLQQLQSLQGDEIDYIEPDGIVTTQ
ncbi:serine proteinase inhibitor IA-1 [Stereum hirsutum FP-91666 SS1]|uniref:serine proteinase inhibitor IA-1 n=1 Tax=Stereum hirsutum (strain FP-91666) TaxID=721885 RepID=UPI000444A80E|nr:serine proteinase inhibitor IA-1 [Stereum hirsutum FP-91666 SS1]EIM84812.1 serine proteinase inhibitor IA-1 [Stereum hirsutum FP-91666 SS1]